MTRVLPRMTDRIALGATGLEVSPFCIGWVRDPDAVVAAFDHGINFFFLTADMHWPVYEGTRRGLAKLLKRRRGRERIVVAAVSYVTQPDFTYAPFLEILEEMPALERLDVLVIGGTYGQEYPTRRDLYRERVQSGENGVRALAASFHDRAAAVEAINAAELDLAFVRYNPLHPGARDDLFPRLRPSTTRVFNFNSVVGYMKPQELGKLGLLDAHWRPRPTDYYRFALSQPAVDGVLCSLHAPSQVVALERALAAGPLDDEEQTYLIDLAKLCSGLYKIDERAGARR